ncbi:hypothetical protein B0I37DRAFT_134565 [Chaetomium sp. MPI-CAGE-AT-0009]|nr:hypothetical protein B0I37DRAFT_134565 [Chaetomium sp. MPI-CAGE-AT-0009]
MQGSCTDLTPHSGSAPREMPAGPARNLPYVRSLWPGPHPNRRQAKLGSESGARSRGASQIFRVQKRILAVGLFFPFPLPNAPNRQCSPSYAQQVSGILPVPTRVVVDEVCDFEARRGIPRRHKSRPSIVVLKRRISCCLGSVRGAEHFTSRETCLPCTCIRICFATSDLRPRCFLLESLSPRIPQLRQRQFCVCLNQSPLHFWSPPNAQSPGS